MLLKCMKSIALYDSDYPYFGDHTVIWPCAMVNIYTQGVGLAFGLQWNGRSLFGFDFELYLSQ